MEKRFKIRIDKDDIKVRKHPTPPGFALKSDRDYDRKKQKLKLKRGNFDNDE